MKSKIALLLATLLFFNIVLPIHAHAAVIPDISQVTATWDPNIETGWDHVYLEYKSLDPQSRYEADKVIAANAYRFLISIGSKQLEDINQQKFDDFLRAVSPFNIAYNNVLAEQVVHSAWVISGEQYKVFCANVIHNIASNPDYYNTHVIKNDSFVIGAGQQSLQVQYNDVDIDQSLNIYNNIFLGNELSSTSAAVSIWFNPNVFGYNGIDITLESLNAFNLNKPSGTLFTPYTGSKVFDNTSESNYLYLPYTGDYTFASGNYVLLEGGLISDSGRVWIQNHNFYHIVSGRNMRAWFNLVDSLNPSFSTLTSSTGNYTFFKESPSKIYNASTDLAYVLDCAKNYFVEYLSDYLVYAEGIKLRFEFSSSNTQIIDVPFPSGYTWVSPQFQPVNIYNNQYYGSDDDTYFHVDQMVDNIINNDYSTVNNGSNNTFYNDNYYITQPVSGGGIELVTSSSIVYNYITIINNGGGSSSGGSIGSYPYPFDVRIINPDDIKNETETNVTNEILNDNDINFGDLNFSPSVTVGLNAAKDSIDGIVPVTGSSIVAQFVSGIPPDWLALGFVFLILFIAAGFGMSIIRH